MSENELRSLSAGLPTYSDAREFLKIIEGVSRSTVGRMIESLWEQRGNPQDQEDWTKPEVWIPERLDGNERELAFRLWRESKERLNPRYLDYTWRFTIKHHLLSENAGTLCVTQRGEQFIQEAENVVAEIDDYEGLIIVLQIVAERGPGKRSEFWDSYATFCRTYTRYRSDNVIAGSLYDRLINLTDRGFILRKGQIYEITDKGLNYLEIQLSKNRGPKVADNQTDLVRLTTTIKKDTRTQLQNYLAVMNPFTFENLIKLLLERMGYDNVTTTSPTNDGGVDVIANIQMGISQVREVVQVKRYKGNVDRPVLDNLRGVLHRFDAVQGTILTTGGFSKRAKEAAFERGAAPITLIDGERLLDLLIEYGIGIRKRQVEYFEFDESDLTQLESKAENGPVETEKQE